MKGGEEQREREIEHISRIRRKERRKEEERERAQRKRFLELKYGCTGLGGFLKYTKSAT